MKKVKDALIIIAGIGIFVGTIGLLMAYSDGLLDGTVVADIISVAFPSFLGAFIITILISYWQSKLGGVTHSLGIIFVISFLVLVICVLLLSKNALHIIALVIVVLTVISLIALWLENLK